MQKATFTDPHPYVSCRLLYLAKSAFREDVFFFCFLFFSFLFSFLRLQLRVYPFVRGPVMLEEN